MMAGSCYSPVALARASRPSLGARAELRKTNATNGDSDTLPRTHKPDGSISR